MKLIIAAIGVMRAGPLRSLVDDYQARSRKLGPSLGFSGPDIRDGEVNRSLQGAARVSAEATILARFSVDSEIRIALDEHGKSMKSEAFAAQLASWRDNGRRSAAFIIGGADGHGPNLLEETDLRLSLGPATWPHMFVRAMLCEQMYRAMTILSGHPYHRE
ncbi:MAG: 23S rRNA (pseudouridine(1915)-N(3))-methyltransferase RlmH [Alphaproteobacteria bacterium]|nr:23S rRNA (pseudouridine(1915)-N(3))-methyltransferase RlmH [Alphaproteobacteria bacterium]